MLDAFPAPFPNISPSLEKALTWDINVVKVMAFNGHEMGLVIIPHEVNLENLRTIQQHLSLTFSYKNYVKLSN